MALEWSGYSFGTASAPTISKPVNQETIMGPELWAALAGALIAGGISVLAQYIVIWDNNRRRDEDLKSTQKALARAVFIKATRIQSSFHNQLKHITEQERVRRSRGYVWRYASIRPLGNLPEKVDFTPDELALVSSLDNTSLLDEFMSLDIRHNSIMPLWLLYESDRRKLEADSPPATFEGAVGTIAYTPVEYRRLSGQMVALDHLLNQMEALLWEYLRETTALMDHLVAGMNSKLQTTFALNYKDSFSADMEEFRRLFDAQGSTPAPSDQ